MKRLNSARLAAMIEAHAAEDLAEGRSNGCAVLVRQAGEVQYQNQFGAAKENTLFRMASMTKPVTAVLTMQLVEQGKLGLDDPIARYLPEFEQMWIAQVQGGEITRVGAARTPITVRHLLSHTSGIGCDTAGELQRLRMTETDRKTLQNAVRYHAAQGLAFEPGTREAYSGIAAFDVLAAVIETVTGERYADLVQAQILTPCEMNDTTFAPSEEQWGRIIPMHDVADGKPCVGETFPGCVFDNFPCSNPLAGAGLLSNIKDYSNFAEMLLSGGVFAGKRILTEASVTQIKTPQVAEHIQPGAERWGLGVSVVVGETRQPRGAYGWSGAYGTHFWVDAENRITVVYLRNTRFDNSRESVMIRRIEEDVAAALEE